MFGSEQPIFLTHQQYQQTLARFQHDQLQQQPRMRVPQQFSSRVQYQNSHRYFQNENSSLQQQTQQATPITNQNEHRSNNFNQQNSFQNHRGKQHHRDYNSRDRDSNNRERNNHHHRKNQNRNNNQQQPQQQQQQQQQLQHQNGNNNSANNNNNIGERQNGKKVASSRLMQTKSEIYHDRRNLIVARSISNESQHKTSTSPTPPSSVKSLSPQKSIQSSETSKDELRLSITSTTSSLPAAINNNNTITVELTDDSVSNSSGNSLSGILIGAGDGVSKMASFDSSSKENSINSWINANNQYAGIHNGLSASAEQLNVRGIDHYPAHFRKRPPSANAIPRDYEISLPFDYYLARIYNCDNDTRSEPPNLKCNSQWDSVSKQIWERYILFQQTQATFRKKIHVWRELFEFLKGFQYMQQRAYSKWGLFLVGSTMTGFGLETSDIDMCLVLKSASSVEPRAEAMVTLSALKNYLIDVRSPFQNFSLINAKVPILRFRDLTNTIEIDLNYNNCIGVRNTNLLYCYAQIDWRLRPLVIMVKLWAQFHNINDARNGTISSYSLVLMVIFFLQHAVKPRVLPCLHKLFPDKFQVMHDITTIDLMESLDVDWKTENKKPIGELFLRFLDYYSSFDYTRNAISVRTGSILLIDECRLNRAPKNEANHWQTLCIEEPFDFTNTARSTYDWDVFLKIKSVFFQSWRKLNETKNMDSLFREPFFIQNIPAHQQYLHQINAQMLQEMKFLMYKQANVQPLNSPILSSPVASNSPEIAS